MFAMVPFARTTYCENELSSGLVAESKRHTSKFLTLSMAHPYRLEMYEMPPIVPDDQLVFMLERRGVS
jgi:hypothetical protein